MRSERSCIILAPAWIVYPSDMVSQLELQWVGGQIVLLFEVWLIIEAYIVIDESDRHDEGDKSLAIITDNLQQLLFCIGGELFLKIAHDVLQDIAMLGRRSLEA